MTDKDDNKIKKTIDKTAEVTKDVTDKIQSTHINDFSTTTGDYLHGQKWTYNLKKGDKFSPKLYKSGWKGGTRAHIKTYEVSKLGKQISKKFTAFERILTGAAIISDMARGIKKI